MEPSHSMDAAQPNGSNSVGVGFLALSIPKPHVQKNYPNQPEPLGQVADAAEASYQRPAVLIVEDDEINAYFMQAVLEPHFNCRIAYSHADACHYLLMNRFDLVLTDMQLLGGALDGYAVLDTARRSRLNAQTPVAAVTAALETNDAYKEAGFADMLAKPYSPEELLELTRRLIGRTDSATGRQGA